MEALINSVTGEIDVTYMQGYPKVIRFDASAGLFTSDEKVPLTATGEQLTIKPVAFRLFKDDILGMGIKKWVEFFYLDEVGCMCNLLLHGFSVEELMKLVPRLFYAKANLCEVALTIRPEARTSKEKKKFYLCSFSIMPLSEDEKALNRLIGESHCIWRQDTLTGDAEEQSSRNYYTLPGQA
jgi:hypothetical protein